MITNDHLLAGPYALDAIDGDELDAFEDHLDGCATCALEVAGFRETASLLAQSVAEPVPAGLLDRIMAEVRTTPQLPPITVPIDESAPTGSDVKPDETETETETETEPALPDNVVPLRSRFRPRWLLSVAAALALLIGAAGAITVVARTNNTSAYESAIEAPGQTHTLAGDNGLSANVKVVDGRPQGAVTANLPPLSADQTYELWFIDGNGAHPATTFTPDEQGNVQVSFTQPVSEPQALGITVEPAGGSNQPTPPIVMQAKVT